MSQHTILAVDDSPVALAAIQQALGSSGFNVVTASSGEAALAQVLYIQPTILLLDVHLPGLDGLEVCRRLRQNPTTARLPIVLLSAYSSLQEKLAGFRAGADDYLVKDRDLRDLPYHLGLVLRLRGAGPGP